MVFKRWPRSAAPTVCGFAVFVVLNGCNPADKPREPAPALTPSITPTPASSPPNRSAIAPSSAPPGIQFQCYVGVGTTKATFGSLAEAWSQRTSLCDATMPVGYQMTSVDRKALTIVYAKEGLSGVPIQQQIDTLADLYGSCAETADHDGTPLETDDLPQWQDENAAVLALCPNAPTTPQRRPLAEGRIVQDGTYEVGVNMVPGTYRSQPGVRDCYWERTTPSGTTIANDFVTYSPKGFTVTVNRGEGFQSERCGPWNRV